MTRSVLSEAIIVVRGTWVVDRITWFVVRGSWFVVRCWGGALDDGRTPGGIPLAHDYACRLARTTCFFSISSIRVCQPGPVARKCLSISSDKRRLVRRLVTKAFGRPRRTSFPPTKKSARRNIPGVHSGSSSYSSGRITWRSIFFKLLPKRFDFTVIGFSLWYVARGSWCVSRGTWFVVRGSFQFHATRVISWRWPPDSTINAPWSPVSCSFAFSNSTP
jgi:hypothetical protein